MLLPAKHISIARSFFGTGSQVLNSLPHSKTVSSLWQDVRGKKGINTFQTYILTLDFLFLLGAIDLDGEGRIEKKYGNYSPAE